MTEGNASTPTYLQDTTTNLSDTITGLHVNHHLLENFISNQQIKNKEAQDIREFYENRSYQYAWFLEEGLAEQTQSFWNLYEIFLNYSGDSSLYNRELNERVNFLKEDDGPFNPYEQDVAITELKLTELFLKFVKRAYSGNVDPESLQWQIPQKKVNTLEILNEFVKNKGKEPESILPVNHQYLLMKEKIIRFQKLQGREWPDIDLGKNKVLKLGDSAAVITDIKNRLQLLGDLPTTAQSQIYDSSLESAVLNFQRRHGLTKDGIVGPAVIKAINIPIQSKIEKMLINMERMRWMPVMNEGRRVVVNIPEFRLHVYEGSNEVLSMNVVVGKSANRTVIFSDKIKNVVFSPFWNIPRSIIRNEILPGIERNPSYLNRHNMEITGNSNGLPIIRQKPGRKNALGRVKFIFPNRYSIYLHDTPSKGLFQRTQRAFSHGCIRVAEPSALAEYLLNDQAGWTEKKIKKAMHSNSEKWVSLKEPVPVFISYFTAWVDESQQLNFRDDIYGHDDLIKKHLFE
ncbi:L,D-transpeptidase family protein [Arcticibacter svalbardensis]|nr:L,D-transpeptidase family protein [Arcticibacter svalbardensis]